MESRMPSSGTSGMLNFYDSVFPLFFCIGAVTASHAQNHSPPTSPHKPASAPTAVPRVDPPPTRPSYSADLNPQDAVARMIGSASRQDTVNNSSFNSRVDVQNDIRSLGYSVTTDSAENKTSVPNPKKTSDNIPSTNLLPTLVSDSVPATSPSPKKISAEALRLVSQRLLCAAESLPDPLLSQAARSVLTILQVRLYRFITVYLANGSTEHQGQHWYFLASGRTCMYLGIFSCLHSRKEGKGREAADTGNG
jgi:hypothetical protein